MLAIDENRGACEATCHRSAANEHEEETPVGRPGRGARLPPRKSFRPCSAATGARLTALASRDARRRAPPAAALGIPKAYGSYEALLADPDIDAVYIPLPNHLHVPWSIRAAEAGKHVLCEKPIALTPRKREQLLAVRDRTGVQIQEAFMVRMHPQWLGAPRAGARRTDRRRPLDLRLLQLFHRRPVRTSATSRRSAAAGCWTSGYLVNTARMIFEAELPRVCALDRRTSGDRRRLDGVDDMDFDGCHAAGTCSTRLLTTAHHDRRNGWPGRNRDSQSTSSMFSRLHEE